MVDARFTALAVRPTPPRASLLAALSALALVVVGPVAPAVAAVAPPDVTTLLAGYTAIWRADSGDTLHGTIVDGDVLARDDQVAVWINQHATAGQRFRALQDSQYQNAAGTGYDPSLTVSTGLGQTLGRLYVQGRQSGALPLTSALVDSSDGSSGAFVTGADAKSAYSHPRPYLPSDPTTPATSGDAAGCAPTRVNGSSQRSLRVGRSYADARGNLRITRLAAIVDTTRQFSRQDVSLRPAYGSTSLCAGGSFPSGHTLSAYEAATTLATLVPELGPELLSRASEAGNNRIVLGVHYPLDVIGGRIAGQAALAAQWSDAAYRTQVLQPARAELRAYLERTCGNTVAWCATHQTAYAANPYAGAAMPGGTAQVVTNRASAAAVYRERLTYGLPRVGAAGRAASVPDGAADLLLTAFPSLTAAQRTSVLAQTEVDSGFPLDRTGTAGGSWQRLDLAAAMSATVRVAAGGAVTVLATGGRAALSS